MAATSFHDITAGDNSYGGIAGFHATRGWDLASGWGTPRAAQLVRVLDPRR